MNTSSTHQAQYQEFVLGNYGPAPLTLVKGRGCRVWDDEGRAYLDFISGIAVNTLGHCHPEWVERVTRQAAELIHTSNLFRNTQQGVLAEKLCQYAGPGKVFFCNSGAEANEALLKLARLHGRKLCGGEEGKRYTVLVAEHAFHGRTFGAMSATPQAKIQNGFGPLLPGFAVGKLNDVESFAQKVDDTTCAIFVETIQGEGGIHPCTAEFLQGLRALCDEHGLLLMIDEVQCGIGRTGSFYAFAESGIQPDAIGMAKGLGGGMPIGAVWMRDAHAELFQPGMHGTTFGGNPLVCAAALATLEILENEGLLEHVRALSPGFRQALGSLVDAYPEQIAEVRGRGFHLALGMRSDPKPFIAALRSNGLLCAGAGANAVRLLPPLNVQQDELDEACGILQTTLQEISV